MTKDEYTNLRSIEMASPTVSVYELENKTPRTLLFGYDVNRVTYHVYLYAGSICWFVYKESTGLERFAEGITMPAASLIPDKRLYPNRCDFEFCKLLRSKGLNLCFTTYDENIEKTRYYGRRMDEV